MQDIERSLAFGRVDAQQPRKGVDGALLIQADEEELLLHQFLKTRQTEALAGRARRPNQLECAEAALVNTAFR